MTLLSQRKKRLRGARVLILLLVFALGYLFTLPVRIYLDGLRDECAKVDVIIVLGAAQYNGRPSDILKARLDHALSLYRQGLAKHLLFTGGRRPNDRYSEAQAGRMYAMQNGVPSCDIFLEGQGRTTMQSLQASADIMRQNHFSSAILVSDPFHAFRLRRMSRDLGMRALVSPAANSRVRGWSKQFHYIAREMAVYAIYRLVGM